MMSSLITTPLELLLPYQARWVADESRFKAGIWSRQSGKDFSTAAEAVRDAMLRAKTTWMIAAPSERQAMESLAKCKEWAEAFSLALAAEEIERQDGPNTLLKSGSITFANGSRILAVPGRPDTVRGFSANLVLTEFAFFEDPDATWRAVLPSITNPLRGGEKKVRLITTPNGKTGRGARTYKIISDNLLQPVEGRKQHWSCHVVTIAKAVEDGLPIDIDELRESLDDPIGWAQEYMCEFLDSSNVLLPYDLLATAESASATVSCDPAIYLGGKLDLRLGIDFGRSNDPTVCWTLERVGDVLVTREVLVLRNMSVPDQMEVLRHRIKARAGCATTTRVWASAWETCWSRNSTAGIRRVTSLARLSSAPLRRPLSASSSHDSVRPLRLRPVCASRLTWRCAKTCTPCSRFSGARTIPTRPRTPERATPTAARPWLWPCARPTATCSTISRRQAAAASSRERDCLAAAPTAPCSEAAPPSTIYRQQRNS